MAAAADAESFGALATGRYHALQTRHLAAVAAMLRLLLRVLKKAGATTQPIKVGKSSFRLRVKGKEQTLVIKN